MKQPYALKFPDQRTAHPLLFDTVQSDEGLVLLPKPGLTVDVIGVIYKTTGQLMDVMGGTVSGVVPITGWHANILCHQLPDGLAPYVINVSNPQRVFS